MSLDNSVLNGVKAGQTMIKLRDLFIEAMSAGDVSPGSIPFPSPGLRWASAPPFLNTILPTFCTRFAELIRSTLFIPEEKFGKVLLLLIILFVSIPWIFPLKTETRLLSFGLLLVMSVGCLKSTFPQAPVSSSISCPFIWHRALIDICAQLSQV